jgi:polysaccharide biosynthesis protein PslH
MRILYFAPHQILPANTGARLRDYQLARQLAGRSAVTFVEMRRDDEEPHILPNDSGLARVVTLDKGRTYTASKIVRGLVGPTSMTVLNCWAPEAAGRLADLLRSHQFDTIQVEGVPLMRYLPIIQNALGSPAVVIDWHNIESELMWRYAETTGNWAKKIAAKRTAKLIEDAEDRLLDTCAIHTVTSERERQKLLAIRPSANIQVVPNGVDTSFFKAEKMAESCQQVGQRESKQTILFVGSMDYHANIDAAIWFAHTAWPEIAFNHPGLQFTIVGRNPPANVRALASDRIHVTGTVDDVRPFYASAMATVVPIRAGGGTRLKILESMAAEVPVVSTHLGAEGLDVEHDVHILLADSGPEIAASVHRIASSAEVRSRLSRAARALVCGTYDWSVIGKQLHRIHANLVESWTAGSRQKVS